MTPDLLGPAVLTPAVLTPAVLTPAVLTPAVQEPAVLVTVDRVELSSGPAAAPAGWVVLEWSDGSTSELPLELWAAPPREGAHLRIQIDEAGPPQVHGAAPQPAPRPTPRPAPRPAVWPDEVDLTSPWRPTPLTSPLPAARPAAAPPPVAIPASGTQPSAASAGTRGAP